MKLYYRSFLLFYGHLLATVYIWLWNCSFELYRIRLVPAEE
jgi:hypothetical protein